MRIWILEIGEPLPLEPDVRLHRYGLFSRFLAARGADVTWWTSSFSHAPKQNLVNQDCEHMIDGVRLKFIYSPGYQKNVSLDRIKHNKHFAARFRELAPLAPKPDLILAPIPIIEAAYEAVQFGQTHNIPVLVDIRDLWPQELVDRAPKPLRWLARILLHKAYQKMQYLCTTATGILGISKTYQQYGLDFAKRTPSETDYVFYLGYAPSKISDEKLNEARTWRDQNGLCRAKLNICFFGTMGNFFDLTTVIQAARELQKELDIQWILCGDGSQAEHFREHAKDLNNVKFTGWVKEPQIQAIMENAHVGIAPYAKNARMALPNKPFEYMSGGLAILSSIRQELPDLLDSFKCGLTYKADSVEDLKNQVRTLAGDLAATRKMGEHARRLWHIQFNTERVFADAWYFIQKLNTRQNPPLKKPNRHASPGVDSKPVSFNGES